MKLRNAISKQMMSTVSNQKIAKEFASLIKKSVKTEEKEDKQQQQKKVDTITKPKGRNAVDSFLNKKKKAQAPTTSTSKNTKSLKSLISTKFDKNKKKKVEPGKKQTEGQPSQEGEQILNDMKNLDEQQQNADAGMISAIVSDQNLKIDQEDNNDGNVPQQQQQQQGLQVTTSPKNLFQNAQQDGNQENQNQQMLRNFSGGVGQMALNMMKNSSSGKLLLGQNDKSQQSLHTTMNQDQKNELQNQKLNQKNKSDDLKTMNVLDDIGQNNPENNQSGIRFAGVNEKKDMNAEKRGSLDIKTKQKLPNIQGFSPKQEGVIPKFYHNFVNKKIHADKSFDSNNRSPSEEKSRNYLKENMNMKIFKESLFKKKNQINIQKSHIKNLTINSMQVYQSTDNLNNERLISAVIQTPGNMKSEINYKSCTSPLDILEYYIDLLKKLELTKFTINFSNVAQAEENNEETTKQLINYSVEIDNVKVSNEIDKESFRLLTKKFGQEYFVMLKQIFNMYGIEKKNMKVMTSRQIIKMATEFKMFERVPKLDKVSLQLQFTERVPKKHGDFKAFVDILFRISKLLPKQNQNLEKDLNFKIFLDDYIVPRYKELSLKFYQYNLDRIQVFYQNYNQYENPTVGLFYENDDLLKHIFALYEEFDIKKSKHSFITLKNFLKMCNDFYLIPVICNNIQITKIFRIFQQEQDEIIGFSSFILILCCIAHIGFSSPAYVDIYKGFYKKVWKLFENLIEINNQVSEQLILQNLLKSKD